MTAPRSTGELHDKTLDAAFPAGRWRVLPERSRVGFRVKKMGLYYVKGTFAGVEGTIDRNGRSELLIDAGSISTRMPPRDWHLRTADFLGSSGIRRSASAQTPSGPRRTEPSSPSPSSTSTARAAQSSSGVICMRRQATIETGRRGCCCTSRASSTGATSAFARARRSTGSSQTTSLSTRNSRSPRVTRTLRTSFARRFDADEDGAA